MLVVPAMRVVATTGSVPLVPLEAGVGCGFLGGLRTRQVPWLLWRCGPWLSCPFVNVAPRSTAWALMIAHNATPSSISRS